MGIALAGVVQLTNMIGDGQRLCYQPSQASDAGLQPILCRLMSRRAHDRARLI